MYSERNDVTAIKVRSNQSGMLNPFTIREDYTPLVLQTVNTLLGGQIHTIPHDFLLKAIEETAESSQPSLATFAEILKTNPESFAAGETLELYTKAKGSGAIMGFAPPKGKVLNSRWAWVAAKPTVAFDLTWYRFPSQTDMRKNSSMVGRLAVAVLNLTLAAAEEILTTQHESIPKLLVVESLDFIDFESGRLQEILRTARKNNIACVLTSWGDPQAWNKSAVVNSVGATFVFRNKGEAKEIGELFKVEPRQVASLPQGECFAFLPDGKGIAIRLVPLVTKDVVGE